MVDPVTPPPVEPTHLHAIVERLERLETLVNNDRLERLEGNEGIEGPPEELPSEAILEEEVGLAAAILPVTESSLALRSLEDELEQFIDGLALQFFRGAEFRPYWSRIRSGVRNSAPPRGIWNHVVPTLVVLERFRREVGAPVRLTSTYRSPRYNRAVGGVSNSQHVQFRAIDFICDRGTPSDWMARLRGYRGQNFEHPSAGSFRFRGGIGLYISSGFVHLDTRGSDADWVVR
jgi:N-acetylmuramoyl-L-alanine amidase